VRVPLRRCGGCGAERYLSAQLVTVEQHADVAMKQMLASSRSSNDMTPPLQSKLQRSKKNQ
jgi:hypothetical protein